MDQESRATIVYACRRLRRQTDVLSFLDMTMSEDSFLDRSARDGLRRIIMNVVEDVDDVVEALERVADEDTGKQEKPNPGEATPTPAPPFYYQG